MKLWLRAIFDRAKFIVQCTDIHGSGHVVFCIAWDEGELARGILARVQREMRAGKVVQL
jgi:hypothetical protein